MKRTILLIFSLLVLNFQFSIFNFQFPVVLAQVPLEAPIGSTTSIDVSGNIIANYTRIIFAFAGGLVGSLAMIMIIISGIQIMVGGGDMTQAKTRLAGALAGLLLLAAGGWLLYIINPCFFTFQESAACAPRS